MKILGINYLSESSISYMDDGILKFSISEERINRIKNWYGNPLKSISILLDKYKINLEDIDFIATHGIVVDKRKKVDFSQYKKKIKLIKSSYLSPTKKNYLIKQLNFRKKKKFMQLIEPIN